MEEGKRNANWERREGHDERGPRPCDLLGGDGGRHGGDGDEPDAAAAAAAAAGGERRGEAERDVVEAERHPGGQWEAEAGTAAAAAPAAGRREIGMWVVVPGGEREERTNGRARVRFSTSGLVRALGF